VSERDFLRELREEERRNDRAMLGCAGASALLFLILVALAFIGVMHIAGGWT
jgi:hypothetical protein